MRGLFIVIEGLDRSGKSSQCTNLTKKFEESGFKTRKLCFPDRTTAIGRMIDQFLKKEIDMPAEAVHLLFAANRWELQETIKTALENGEIIFTDRYYYSGVSYSAAAWGLERNWCLQPENGLIAPDATLFFNVTPEVAAARGGYGLERYEKQEIQERVRKEFQQFTATEKRWCEIDASGTVEEVFEIARAQVQALIDGDARQQPIHITKY